MKILAVVESKHLGNTEKIAKAMAEVAPLTVIGVDEAVNYKFHDYDIVGFGSGIYMGKHDDKLIDFVSSLYDEKEYTFVISTSGSSSFEKNNNALVQLLKDKNKTVLGTFSCKGLDKFFVFKLLGGINKGHPNKQDLANSQEFILDIIEKYKKAEGK